MARNLIGRLSVYLGTYCNAIAFTVIFPFGSKMVQHLGMTNDRSSTGVWVGILAFTMMGSRVFASPIWGIICDKYGRRPAHICGLVAVILFSLSFGLSSEYWMAVVSRGFCLLYTSDAADE